MGQEAKAEAVPRELHPALGRAFAALDGAGVTWCLLRGEADLADPGGDVDLLVAADDLPRLDALVAAAGFVRRPAWGAGEHREYVGYDDATDRFVTLDVEWSVVFGPSGSALLNWLRPAIRTTAAGALLAGRRRVGPVWLLDPDDAFWALLLHCIVDKGAVAEKHEAHLTELAAGARPDGVLGPVVTARGSDGWDATRVIAAARHADWPALVELGTLLPGRASAASRIAALGRGLRRLPEGLRGRRGFSVALLGPDGAGKSTLANGIVASSGLPSRLVYQGLWQGESGERGPAVALLAAARRPLRSWRRSVVAWGHQRCGRLVVFDRHPYDALLPPAPPHVAAKRLFFAFLARTVPAPSLVLVLDLPADVTAARRPEESPAELAAARAEYAALPRRLPHGVPVEVLDADCAPLALRAAAIAAIWRALQAGARASAATGPSSNPSPGSSTPDVCSA